MEPNTVQQCQGEHTSPPAKSYSCFTIEHDTSSGTEVPMFQTVWPIIKTIFQSHEGISIIPPSFQDHSSIWSNKALPEKENARLMCQYIRQGRILPASFSGKLLICHPSKADILSSWAKALENYYKVRMSHVKFGISKVINIGILCGKNPTGKQTGSVTQTGILNVHAGGWIPHPTCSY